MHPCGSQHAGLQVVVGCGGVRFHAAFFIGSLGSLDFQHRRTLEFDQQNDHASLRTTSSHPVQRTAQQKLAQADVAPILPVVETKDCMGFRTLCSETPRGEIFPGPKSPLIYYSRA